jgi:hypothetical protein
MEHRASTTFLFEAVVEVSIAFKFFIKTGLLALCSNPQPGGASLHIYIPWRLGGPIIPPGTGYPFYSPLTTRMGYGGTILIPRSPHGDIDFTTLTIIGLLLVTKLGQ